MPDRTPCVHCDSVGYVRREHVIEAGRALIQFYCGRCERTWTVAEEQDAPIVTPRRRGSAKTNP